MQLQQFYHLYGESASSHVVSSRPALQSKDTSLRLQIEREMRSQNRMSTFVTINLLVLRILFIPFVSV